MERARVRVGVSLSMLLLLMVLTIPAVAQNRAVVLELATLDSFAQDDVLAANRNKTTCLNHMARPLSEHRAVRNWRNTGMIWAFEVTSSTPHYSRAFYQAALQHELLLRPMGNTVYFMPPYVIEDDEIDLLAARTAALIDALPPD